MVKFTVTKLVGKNKVGVVKPDESGYYTMLIGGLNTFNSMGEYYTLQGAKDLFESSSMLMNRLKGGYLKAELGHPKKLSGMSMEDYVNRVHQIEETNTAAHFKEIWLDEKYGVNTPSVDNPNFVAIMGKFKPCGPRGKHLEKALNNPDENVAFSVRGLTDDYFQGGKTIRVLRTIITFDYVEAPGIAVANKYDSPSLESESLLITSSIIDRIKNATSIIATEDTKSNINETFKVMHPVCVKPAFKEW